jgi:hypothetical protein
MSIHNIYGDVATPGRPNAWSNRLLLRGLVGPEPFANIGPRKTQIFSAAKRRQRLAVAATSAAFFIDPRHVHLKALSQLHWGQNIFRCNRGRCFGFGSDGHSTYSRTWSGGWRPIDCGQRAICPWVIGRPLPKIRMGYRRRRFLVACRCMEFGAARVLACAAQPALIEIRTQIRTRTRLPGAVPWARTNSREFRRTDL